MVNRVLCVLLVAALFSSPSSAQDKSFRLDSLFTYYNDNGMFSGSVLAAENGKVIYRKAFGFSDVENKVPLEISSVLSIGSVTKPFTALAIMMLKEDGLLSYEDKLLDYFPEFPAYAESITIRHLLTHTSGLVDYINDLHLLETLPELTDAVGLDSLIKQPALKYETGKKFSYCNSGYFLLGLIVEKVTGQTYREFLERNILQPLGMNHTYVLDESTASIPGRTNSYRLFWEKSDDDLRLKAQGNGNMYSTVDDLFLFDQALYTDKLIRRETLKEAYATEGLLPAGETVYGFGWTMPTEHGGNIAYHNGGLAGFRAHFWRDLRNRNTLIALSNNTWLQNPDILSAAHNIMLGRPYSLGKIMASALFIETLHAQGSDAALKAVRAAAKDDSSRYACSPDQLNDIGFFFLNGGQFAQAIKAFELGVELYPTDYNLWDSLGLAHMTAGNRSEAIRSYRKALELNPDCETSRSALHELEKEKASSNPASDGK